MMKSPLPFFLFVSVLRMKIFAAWLADNLFELVSKLYFVWARSLSGPRCNLSWILLLLLLYFLFCLFIFVCECCNPKKVSSCFLVGTPTGLYFFVCLYAGISVVNDGDEVDSTALRQSQLRIFLKNCVTYSGGSCVPCSSRRFSGAVVKKKKKIYKSPKTWASRH